MGDISQHISRHESACKCGCGLAVCDKELVEVLEDVCDTVQSIDENITRVILHINSWCRCYSYDKSLKESLGIKFTGKSKHIKCTAVDFWLETVYKSGIKKKVDDGVIYDYLDRTYPDKYGLGRYTGRTHIDVRKSRARWDNR